MSLKPKNLKDWNVFAERDPFNDNFVEGLLCRQSGNLYGALYIERVNHRPCEQLIYCTPKLYYPFDNHGNWHFPKAKRIERYTKLDGTNIFAFFYKDVKGELYLSYKVRLNPFVKNSRFGPFQDMWKEILENQPEITRFSWKTKYNISYELWGARNSHLIQYDAPLAASMLFLRNGEKLLPPPSDVDFKAPFLGIIDRDYVWNYQEAQRITGENLKQAEDKYLGDEGEVWYLLDTNDKWHLFKCKPHEIEQIHWAAGGIGKNIIITTCQNAFESWDDPTVENVKQLLREEFSEPAIEKIIDSVPHYLASVKREFEFKAKVMEEYNQLGINILEDKSGVMRALSTKFGKSEMKKVFSVIWSQA